MFFCVRRKARDWKGCHGPGALQLLESHQTQLKQAEVMQVRLVVDADGQWL